MSRASSHARCGKSVDADSGGAGGRPARGVQDGGRMLFLTTLLIFTPLAGSSGVLPRRCTRDSLAHRPIMTHQPAPLPPCRICWGTGSTRRSRAPWGRTRPASTGGAGRRRQRQHEGGGSCVSPALQQYRWSEAGTVVLASEFSRVLRLPAPCMIGE